MKLIYHDVVQQLPDGKQNRIAGIRLPSGEFLQGLVDFHRGFRQQADGSLREVLTVTVAEFDRDERTERVVFVPQAPVADATPSVSEMADQFGAGIQ